MTKEELIKDAQYRKSLSIAYFNATNAAVELVKERQIADRAELLQVVVNFRDFFLDEHAKYHAEVIARIGIAYDVKESIAKLQAVQSIDELQKAWLMLSEDERRDEAIAKVKNELKEKFNAKA